MQKDALHAHERGAERLNLPETSVNQIQEETDKMWYGYGRKKLISGNLFYSPLRDPKQNLIGYATFQKVGKNPYRSRLILTTILSNRMKPRGDNIGGFFDTSIQGIIPKDPNELKPFKGMHPIPDIKRKQS